MDNAINNTDKEIWREREGDYYADSIHVNESGGIGINCGGTVIVKSIREWFALADKPSETESLDSLIACDCYWHRTGTFKAGEFVCGQTDALVEKVAKAIYKTAFNGETRSIILGREWESLIPESKAAIAASIHFRTEGTEQ